MKKSTGKRLSCLLLTLVLLLGLLPAAALAEGTGYVSSEAEFLAMEPAGSYALTKDITVTSAYSQTFTGSFDGKGHTITLAITGSESNVGLFKEVGTNGTVENVLTEGFVSGSQYVAGIAGKSAGTIKNCLNKAAISASNSSAYAGGIAGQTTSGSILSCGNTGNVTASADDARYVGGIVAEAKGSSITNCYNQGVVSSPRTRAGVYMGGIVGSAAVNSSATGTVISKCYSTGTIDAKSETNYGAIAGWCYNSTVTDCYYLNSSSTNGSNGNNTTATSKTEDEMKDAAFAGLLGEGFMFRAGSYPVLAWQTPTASVAFTLSPANAVLTINGGSYTGSTTVSLPAGEYPYTVTCDGYTQQGDTISVSAEQAESGAVLPSVSVTLDKDASLWCTTRFVLTPSDAAVAVKDGDTVVTPESDGSYQLLRNHSYTYTVTHSDETYVAKSEKFILNATETTYTLVLKQVASIELAGTYKTEYTQGDKLDTTGMQIILHFVGSEETETVDVNSDVQITGFDFSQPADEQTLTVTYYGRSATYTVKINEKGFPSTIFNTLKGKATVEYSHNSSYKGEDGQEFVDHTDGSLKSNSADMNNSTVTITIKFADNLPDSVFSFDYKVSAENYGDGIQINGGSTIGGQQTSFTNYTANVKGGDTFTITYKKDYSARGGDDCVYLKNFQLGQLHDFKLTVSPEDADVTLTKQGDTTAISGTQTGGEHAYQLMAGDYTYTVSKFGYTAETGTVTVPTDSEKTVTLVENAKQTVTFTVTKPEDVTGDYTLTVKHGEDTMTPTEANTYSLYDGDYTYTVTHDRCETESGSFTVSGAAVGKTVMLVRKLVFADFFDGVDGLTAANDATYPFICVKDEAGNYLQTNEVKNYQTTKITLTATENVMLSFDYWGSNYTSSYSSYPFTVVKDSTTLLTSEGKSSWNSFSTPLLAGEVLTLSYKQPYDYSVNTYKVKLKDFATQALHTVTFTGLPEGAELVVKSGDTVQTAQSAGTYLLPAGSYSYTVSKFGYTPQTGTVTVTDGAQTVAVPALVKLPSYSVSFQITLPEGFSDGWTAEIKSAETVVYSGDGTVVCSLPAGEYSFTVSHPNCDAATGSLTVADGGENRITAALARKLVFSDFFQGLDGLTATNDTTYPYKAVKDEENGNYLQSDGVVNYKTTTITLNASKDLRLSFSYLANTYSTYYPFTIKRGTTVLKKDSESTAWQSYSVDLKAGESLTLEYTHYKSSYSSTDYYVRLKDFEAQALYSVSFSGVPEGAQLTVRDSAEQLVAAQSDASYLLPAGSYSYTVSKFGFCSEAGSLTVEAAQTVEVPTLQALESYQVSFETDPADAAVTLTHAAAGTISPAEDLYTVYAGETYRYTVSKADYITVEGSFTAAESGKITVTLTYAGAGWDGSSAEEPGKNGAVYQIGSAAELAWFAQQVNGDQPGISAKLTANINLGGKDWSSLSFGNYDYKDDASGFAGTLDGQNYMVSGLSGSKGLINCLSPTGTVKNLCVNGEISGSGNVGGIVSISKGTVENCKFFGAVSNSSSYGGTGGIVGCMQGAGSVLRGCVNAAAVSNTTTSYGSNLNTGGVAGYVYGRVENCYNSGTVSAQEDRTTNKAIGGLVGQAYASAVLQNCYNAGTVTGPAAGIGAFAGINKAEVVNCYYLEGTAAQPLGENSAAAAPELTAKSPAQMREDLFAYRLGSAYNKDSGGINSGYPVLTWQGGSQPVLSGDVKDAVEAAAALKLKDKQGAELSPDGEGLYQIRDAAGLTLETTLNGCTVTWQSDNAAVTTSGTVTLPETGKTEVTLTALVQKGEAQEEKSFRLVLWSQTAQTLDQLEQIKAQVENAAIQPLEMYGHTNITQAMEQYLYRKGISVQSPDYDETGVTVTFLSPGSKSTPNDNTDYIDSNGDITYFTGDPNSVGTKNAYYTGVQFRLTLDGQSVDVTVRANIGWQESHVESLLDNALDDLGWDDIKNTNTNTVTVTSSEYDWWTTVTVNGEVSDDLTLPTKIAGHGTVTVKWTSKDSDCITVEEKADSSQNIYYLAHLNRPRKGAEPVTFTLTAVATFNLIDDYMLEEGGTQGATGDYITAQKNFVITIAPMTEDPGAAMQAALEAKYESLLRDFVDKDQTVDTANITDDLQMPRPQTLMDEEIMDRWEYQVKMESGNTDYLVFNGYHAEIYRPLPGGNAVRVPYTITIHKYKNPSDVYAQATFYLTIQPLTQAEIDEAAAFMQQACTEEVYWNGIKNENADKNNVTGDLKPFSEILQGEDGQLQYIRGAINLTFGGIEVDDLPGYDPFLNDTWREFRTTRPTILAYETLQLTQPEYNSQVRVDSVLTHSEFGKYWLKFQDDPAYVQFKQFYKQPVAVTVTVAGTSGRDDPNPQADIAVKVSVDGKGFKNFQNLSAITADDLPPYVSTAWDAVQQALTKAGYSYTSSGSYVSGITDPNGVSLTDTDTANSGWLYKVNGKVAEVYMGSYYLQDGDRIELYYTSDWKEEPDLPMGGGEEDSLPFTDVNGHWALEGIRYVYENKIFQGVSDTLFDPDGTMDRAMLVTALYRLAGSPSVHGQTSFTDVKDDTWYSAAIAWAAETGLVDGYGDGTFGPEDEITREQMAAVLYRYARYKGYDVSQAGMALREYADYGEISGWALESLAWANAAGLVTGRTASTIVPQGLSTRAEVATLIMRFMENIVK